MRRGQWAEELGRLQAASRDGVISAAELVRLGVPERTVYRRTARNGPWTLLLPATIMLGNGEPTLRQRQIAALTYTGPNAVLTGLGGARLLGLRRGGEPEGQHLLIPIAQQIQSVGSVTVERTRRMPGALERQGLPVAPIARCLIDYCRTTKDEDLIAAVLTEPVQRRMVLVEQLSAELDAASRKGTAAPRRVMRALEVGVESPAEYQYLAFWLSIPGLPAVQCNVPVSAPDGSLIGIADFLVPELGFVWECDSVEEHFATPTQVQETAERARALRALGLYVLSTRPTQRRDDPRGVESDIRHGLAVAASMPPPQAIFGRSRAA